MPSCENRSAFVTPPLIVMALALDLGYGQHVNFVTREQWGALPPVRQFEKIRPPVSRIRFAYTGKDSCTNTEDCMKIVQELQRFYLEKGKPDLPYNFIVGGDCCVYEAAGWEQNSGSEPSHSWLQGKSVTIAYLGTYRQESPPYEMICVAMDLVKYGLRQKIIHPLFKLVPGPKEKKSHNEETKGSKGEEGEGKIEQF